MQLSLVPNGAHVHLTLGHLRAPASREDLAGLARALSERDVDWDWRVSLPGHLDVYRSEGQVDVPECLPLCLRETDDPDESVTLSEQQAAQAGEWLRAALRANLNQSAHLSL